jgi:hypothetical protein
MFDWFGVLLFGQRSFSLIWIKQRSRVNRNCGITKWHSLTYLIVASRADFSRRDDGPAPARGLFEVLSVVMSEIMSVCAIFSESGLFRHSSQWHYWMQMFLHFFLSHSSNLYTHTHFTYLTSSPQWTRINRTDAARLNNDW